MWNYYLLGWAHCVSKHPKKGKCANTCILECVSPYIMKAFYIFKHPLECAPVFNSFCLYKIYWWCKTQVTFALRLYYLQNVVFLPPGLGDSFVNEEEDGFLRRQLDTFPDDPHKLSHSDVRGHQVLPLINVHYLRPRNLLHYHLEHIHEQIIILLTLNGAIVYIWSANPSML